MPQIACAKKGLRYEKPSTVDRDSIRGLRIDFLLGNGRDMTRNVSTVDTVSRTLVPVDVLDTVLLMECTGRKWGHCSVLFLSQTIE